MTGRAFVRDLLPPLLTRQWLRWSGRSLRFAGQPADWAEAQRQSGGYDAADILDRVRQATRAVVSGQARYERDAVLSDEPEYPFAVIAALLRAADPQGRLDVVDFGGSLGSSYRQCRPLLDRLSHLRWHVVEQPSFVAAGRQEFSTEELGFSESLATLPPPLGPRVVLASSVLQYLAQPYALLDEIGALGASGLVIDRTPMGNTDDDRLCIQHVPAQIYRASYPCRLLSRPKLLAHLQAVWTVRAEFTGFEGLRSTDDGLPFEYRGMLLDRKP
jgi:putative methyltransferase (TIGR04325 family)